MPNILGIFAFYHKDVTVIIDDTIITAVQEERFTIDQLETIVFMINHNNI